MKTLDDAPFLDIFSESFQEEHLPQAINIPTDQLEQRLSELPRNKEIVPYCWTLTCHLLCAISLVPSGNP